MDNSARLLAILHAMEPVVIENLWGYAKRLRFVQHSIAETYPAAAAECLRILDVGCGNGAHLALPLARQGYQVTGIDTDARSIQRALALSGNRENAQFVCGTIDDLNAGLFDIVILSEVLEHVQDPEALLRASLRHLKRAGVAIVTVPNGYGEFEIDSWFFRTFRLQALVDLMKRNKTLQAVADKAPTHPGEMAATENEESGHVQFFTIRRLRKLFASCSLTVFREGAASLLAGPVIAYTLARSPRFIEWNARITDHLPLFLASGLYFALRKDGQEVSQTEAGR